MVALQQKRHEMDNKQVCQRARSTVPLITLPLRAAPQGYLHIAYPSGLYTEREPGYGDQGLNVAGSGTVQPVCRGVFSFKTIRRQLRSFSVLMTRRLVLCTPGCLLVHCASRVRPHRVTDLAQGAGQ
ncbi:unnamed protein product [Boreogadus saida]